ncbi:MAG: PAS domain S-box protein [Candidatus Reddybacter sp.]
MHEFLNGLRTTTGILDCDSTLVFTNDTPLKATAITMEDVIGKKFWDCPWWNYDPNVQALIQSDVTQAAAGKSTSRDVLSFSPRGLLWIQLNIYPNRDDSGSIIRLVAEGVAIHKRKLAEEGLRASAQHLKAYRDHSPLAIIEWNYTGSNAVVNGWNKAAETMFGYTFTEVQGKMPQFIAPAELDLKLDQHITDLKARTDSGTVISKNLSKDGRTIYCQWYNAPLKDKTGELIDCDSILRDITAEREAQRALAISEAEQRDNLSSMLEAVTTYDETSAVLTFNKAAEKLFGYSAEEIVGQNIVQLIPEPLCSGFAQAMAVYLDTGNLSKLGAGT